MLEERRDQDGGDGVDKGGRLVIRRKTRTGAGKEPGVRPGAEGEAGTGKMPVLGEGAIRIKRREEERKGTKQFKPWVQGKET